MQPAPPLTGQVPVPDRRAQTVGHGKWLRLVDDSGWEYVERCRGSAVVGIIALTSGGEVILVEQYRPAMRASCIELPAGLVGDSPDVAGEALLSAAARELEEETGYRASQWQHLMHGGSSTGLSSETIHIYLATGLTRVSAGGGDASENITVHHVPADTLEDWLAEAAQSGKVLDIKLLGVGALARALSGTSA